MNRNIDDLLAELLAAMKFADERFQQLTAIVQVQKALTGSNRTEHIDGLSEVIANLFLSGQVTGLPNFFADLEKETIKKLAQKGTTGPRLAKILGISYDATRVLLNRRKILLTEERARAKA